MLSVEMVRGEWGAPKQVYDVGISGWRTWLAKASEHGWNPQGTHPAKPTPQTQADYSQIFTSRESGVTAKRWTRRTLAALRQHSVTTWIRTLICLQSTEV